VSQLLVLLVQVAGCQPPTLLAHRQPPTLLTPGSKPHALLRAVASCLLSAQRIAAPEVVVVMHAQGRVWKPYKPVPGWMRA
jgi:hypothetical protein